MRAKRLLGVLTLLVCVALVCVAPASAAPVTFGEGHLDWGFKQSFREYVVGIAEGEYTASDGATKLSEPTGVIRFDVLGGPYDDATGVGELLIDGTVNFTGHHGALDMTIENLRLDLVGSTATLHADLVSKDLESGVTEECRDVALGNLGSVPAPTANGSDGLTWGSIPVALATASAPVFEDFYSAGAELDPLAPLVADFGTPRPRPDGGNPGPPTAICGADDPGPGPGPGGGGAGGGTGGGGSVPDPAPEPPRVSAGTKAVTLGAGRVAAIATLRCGGAPCALKAPKSVKVKIDGKRYAVGVLVPKTLTAGKAGKLRVKLSKRARKALTGRKTIVKVEVTIAAGGRKFTKTVKATLKAKKAKG